MTSPNQTFYTLDDLQAQKESLRAELDKKGEQVGTLWNNLFSPKKANTKGELVTSIISNSITAIDTFMLAKKLITKYGNLFKRKKRR